MAFEVKCDNCGHRTDAQTELPRAEDWLAVFDKYGDELAFDTWACLSAYAENESGVEAEAAAGQ